MTPTPAARDAARGGDGKITRELVFAIALELIDRDGADALSMRRLGAALDRDPMILYRHAPGKAALLDGVVETVLAQLKVDPADPDWTAQLRARRPRVPRAGPGPPQRGPAARHPAAGHPARAPPPRHPAPARGRPRPAHPRRVQRTGRAAHLPGPVRLPQRPRAQRAARTRREPGRDRRPAAAGPAPAADRRIPAAAQPRPRPGQLRRRRRARTRPRHPADRAGHHTVTGRRGRPAEPERLAE